MQFQSLFISDLDRLSTSASVVPTYGLNIQINSIDFLKTTRTCIYLRLSYGLTTKHKLASRFKIAQHYKKSRSYSKRAWPHCHSVALFNKDVENNQYIKNIYHIPHISSPTHSKTPQKKIPPTCAMVEKMVPKQVLQALHMVLVLDQCIHIQSQYLLQDEGGANRHLNRSTSHGPWPLALLWLVTKLKFWHLQLPFHLDVDWFQCQHIYKVSSHETVKSPMWPCWRIKITHPGMLKMLLCCCYLKERVNMHINRAGSGVAYDNSLFYPFKSDFTQTNRGGFKVRKKLDGFFIKEISLACGSTKIKRLWHALKIASHVSEHDSSKVSPLATAHEWLTQTNPIGTPSGCRKSTKYRTDNRMDTLVTGIHDKKTWMAK